MKVAIVLLIIGALAAAHTSERRRRLAAEQALRLWRLWRPPVPAAERPARIRYGTIPTIGEEIWCQPSDNFGFRGKVAARKVVDGLVDRLIVTPHTGGAPISVSLNDVVPL